MQPDPQSAELAPSNLVKDRLPRRLFMIAMLAGITVGLAPVFMGGCTIARGFDGPGFDDGSVQSIPADQPVTVMLTYGKLDGDKREPFDRYVGIIDDALPQSPGLIGYSLRKELFGDEVWTMSVWDSQDSLWRFVYGDVHGAAMSEASEASIIFTSALFERPAGEIPLDWEEAEQILAEKTAERARGDGQRPAAVGRPAATGRPTTDVEHGGRPQ